jgi:hypothetical protein
MIYPVPSDTTLYAKTKSDVDKIWKKPSAFRSMAYARYYIKAYREKYGLERNGGHVPEAYKGVKTHDLQKWEKDKWVDIGSYLEDPKHPVACGGTEDANKKGKYPLCMPLTKAKQYSTSELQTLLARKQELGQSRLVKDSYLKKLREPKETRTRKETIADKVRKEYEGQKKTYVDRRISEAYEKTYEEKRLKRLRDATQASKDKKKLQISERKAREREEMLKRKAERHATAIEKAKERNEARKEARRQAREEKRNVSTTLSFD